MIEVEKVLIIRAAAEWIIRLLSALVAGRLIGNTYVLHYGVDQSLDVKLGLCILSTKERLLGLVDSRLAIANVHIHCVVLEESGISGLILHSGLIGINVFEDIVHKSIDVNAIHF